MAIKRLTLEEFIEFMRQKQGDLSDRQFAQDLGVSPQRLCDIYNGRRIPGESVASALDAERSVTYAVNSTPTKNSEDKK